MPALPPRPHRTPYPARDSTLRPARAGEMTSTSAVPGYDCAGTADGP